MYLNNLLSKRGLKLCKRYFEFLSIPSFHGSIIKYLTPENQWSTEQSRFLRYRYLCRQILQMFVFYENSRIYITTFLTWCSKFEISEQQKTSKCCLSPILTIIMKIQKLAKIAYRQMPAQWDLPQQIPAPRLKIRTQSPQWEHILGANPGGVPGMVIAKNW